MRNKSRRTKNSDVYIVNTWSIRPSRYTWNSQGSTDLLSFQGRGVTTKGVPRGWGVLHKMIIQLFHGRHTVQTMLAALPLWVAKYSEGQDRNRNAIQRFAPVKSASLEPISHV